MGIEETNRNPKILIGVFVALTQLCCTPQLHVSYHFSLTADGRQLKVPTNDKQNSRFNDNRPSVFRFI